MSDFDYDLFVIGGGSGGVRAARMAAQFGARVAIAEEYRYGGTCVIRGCVPKKLMVYASSFHEAFEDAAGFGWTVPEPSFDWTRLIAAKDTEIDRLEAIYNRILDSNGVEVHRSRATVVDAHTVHLTTHGKNISAKHILVATGGTPFVPDFPGSEHAITSNEIFHLAEQPRRAIIVGGGYIASEFAGILNGLGSQVTQVYRRDLILRGFDDEVRAHVSEEMAKKGVNFRYNTDVAKIDKTPEGLVVTFEDGTQTIADQVLYIADGMPLWVLQAAIAVLATFFTLVMSNVGATVLLVPLAVNIALGAGADPALFALTVAISTSNSFLIPTHQVNALIMGPAGYRVPDFMRAGGVMTVLFLVVMMLMMQVVF